MCSLFHVNVNRMRNTAWTDPGKSVRVDPARARASVRAASYKKGVTSLQPLFGLWTLTYLKQEIHKI